MPWKDPEKVREATRKKVESKRAISYQFTCLACDNLDPTVVEWHHIDEATKSFGIANGMSKSHDAWWDELLKCVPLCANCHRKLHMNQLCLLREVR